jgi:predicted ArsR family transcriptional regulator
LYKRSSRQLSVTLPERRYDLAAQLLASAIDAAIAESSTVTDALNAAAANWGGTIGDQARAGAGPRPSRERLVTSTCGALTEYGYEPRRVGGAIVLCNCPFDTLARQHTQLVCGMNLTMLAAAADRVSKTGLAARFEPAPDRCCVVLDAD